MITSIANNVTYDYNNVNYQYYNYYNYTHRENYTIQPPPGTHQLGSFPVDAHHRSNFCESLLTAHQHLSFSPNGAHLGQPAGSHTKAYHTPIDAHPDQHSGSLTSAHPPPSIAVEGTHSLPTTSSTGSATPRPRALTRPSGAARRKSKKVATLLEDNIEGRKYITNLSSKHLSSLEVTVLSKGLKFIPSSRTDKSKLLDSVSSFERLNRLKYFFRDHAPLPPHPLRGKSAWIPPRASPHIEAYLTRVRAQATALPPLNSTHNLTPKERKVLKSLASDDSIVIKSADKGSGIVVEDRTGYIAAGLDHLSDTSIYEEIDSDPTPQLALGINTFVNRLFDKGIIDKITQNYLLFPESKPPRTQQLYFLKKIHKNPISVRPIVSGCGGPTERISRLIDLHLQPEVPLIDSYIRDSAQLVQLLEDKAFPDNATLASIDVKALYTNIPHAEGIRAVLNRLYYNNADSDTVAMPPGTMSDLLKIVLGRNYFQFADKMYHQVQGTAMGTKMAPAYANLFMAELERELLADSPITPLLWKRYIDDILCIWPGTPDSLREFIDQINSKHNTIKFTYEASQQSIDFLDLTIYKGERFLESNKLDVRPYFKSTNKFQYLEYNSAHPRSTFNSLIRGEMTRLLRASSDPDIYLQMQQKMHAIFIERGYPCALVDRSIQSVQFSERSDKLRDRDRGESSYDTYLVTEYAPDLDTRKLNSILKPDTTEAPHVPKPCLSLRRKKNLANHLVRAKLPGADTPPLSTDTITIRATPNMTGNSAGCAITGCRCCAVMSRREVIISTHNHKAFTTPGHTNCSTNCVIYLLECTKCTKGNQYVGQTERTLGQRVAGHRAACTKKKNLPLYKHFLSKEDHNFQRDVRFTILEKTTRTQLTARESHWMTTLETVFPKGLNSRYE